MQSLRLCLGASSDFDCTIGAQAIGKIVSKLVVVVYSKATESNFAPGKQGNSAAAV